MMMSLLRVARNTDGSGISLTVFPSTSKILTLRWLNALSSLLRGQTNHFHLRRFTGNSSSSWRSKGDKPVCRSWNCSPQEREFRLDWSIVEESSFRCDICAVVSDFQNLFVILSPLSKSHLACSRYGVHDVVRMPGTDRDYSSNGLSRLVFELLYSPSLYWTLNALSLCNPDDVHVHSFLEDISNLHFLAKQLLGEFQLILYSSSIDLYLHQIGLLLSDLSHTRLARGDSPHLHDPFLRGLELLPALVIIKLLGNLNSATEILRRLRRPYFA